MAKNPPVIESLHFFQCNFKSPFKETIRISVSGECMSFIFKICQTVAVISMISQLHRFLNYFLADFLAFGPTVRRQQQKQQPFQPWGLARKWHGLHVIGCKMVLIANFSIHSVQLYSFMLFPFDGDHNFKE